MTHQIIIDATNATLGRLASYAAKQSLLGREVIIVNCNAVIISGAPQQTLNKYKKAKARGGSALKGPFFPRSPEKIMKRAIRGMLPDHREGRGKEALRRIMCYNLVPPEFEKEKKISSGKPKITKTITLKRISELV